MVYRIVRDPPLLRGQRKVSVIGLAISVTFAYLGFFWSSNHLTYSEDSIVGRVRHIHRALGPWRRARGENRVFVSSVFVIPVLPYFSSLYIHFARVFAVIMTCL